MQTMFIQEIINKVIPLGLLGLLLLSKPASANGSSSINLSSTKTLLKESQLIALEPVSDNKDSIPIPVITPQNDSSLVETPVLIPTSVDPTNYSPSEETKPVLIEQSKQSSNSNNSQSIPIAITPPLINSDNDTPVYSDSISKQNTIVAKYHQRQHKVEEGETLSSIASQYGVSREQLIQANNLSNLDTLEVNQLLTIPSETSENLNKPILIAVQTQDNFNTNKNLRESSQIKPSSEVKERQANQDTAEMALESSAYNTETTEEELVTAIPIEVEYYNPMLQPTPGEMVSPDLPQLYPPDRYLPDSNIKGTFNGYIWPAKGVLTSGYGWRWGRMHRGIDIAAPVGTPVVASADGQVLAAGWHSGGYGNLVKLKHFDGSVTLYAHNSKIFVRRGQMVNQGQQIAAMGSTGYSTGPHLHFEIRPDSNKAVNPIAFLPRQ